jgi:chemotaxis protein histidine kinase CheA/ActR/RegA family two-component response regulator
MTMWERYVASAVHDAEQLVTLGDPDELRAGDPSKLGGLAHVAFRLGLSSSLIGAADVAALAFATERALDHVAAGRLAPDARSTVASAIRTLHDAVSQLASPDKSGARVEGLPLDDRREAIEAIVAAAGGAIDPPAPTGPPPPAMAVAVAAAAAAAPHDDGPAGAFAWTPTVDDDMVELFFDEATERCEALSGKLVEIERNPGDGELLRDVFRDLHTVKGSSAMVGLVPVNHLAHAAEDLVGQIRDAGRAVDAQVVDALLAALDGLRAMLGAARARAPVAFDPAPVVARLRDPHGARLAPAPVVAAPTPPPAAMPGAGAHSSDARQTIRVDFDKLDHLLNLVGELVLGRDDLRGAVNALASITAELAADRGVARRVVHARGAAMSSGPSLARNLDQLGDELGRVERVLASLANDLDHGTDRLDTISGELREQVMRLRMVPVGGVFRKHVRTVRDLAASLAKRARLELVGDDTELDKLLVEALDEPLMHLVRNAVDHGLEPPDARIAAGKPAEGVIKLEARHRGNQVEIRVSDDGRGLDPAKLVAKAIERGIITAAEGAAMSERDARELVFRAGFSTAAQVSEVSGRGVGMDAVRSTIVSKLKGTIEIESTTGKGSAFVLELPLTLAIIQVILARASGETYAIPLDIVMRVLTVPASEVQLIADREVVVVRGRHVPLIRLDHVLELDGAGAGDELQLVLVEHGGNVYALVFEQLLGKREIVIKSLGAMLANVPCVAGATLLADRVALILDVPAVMARALAQPARRPVAPAAEPEAARAARAASHAASTQILLVEDSDIIREALRRLLAEAGYLVTVAVDGQHGLELARSKRFDLVSTDVVMPRMDGYELTRALRATAEYANVPIVMVTSRGERIDRVRGFDAGVDEYITKPHDRQVLLRVVRKLLGHAHGEEG